jgi:alpha-tubulin suppressor-like RCC1 family protein
LNNYGQLGLGDTASRSSPVQVGALGDWSQVSASYRLSTAIKTDGTLWAWGRGNNGALGLGDAVSRSSPAQVGALTAWANVSASANITLVVKTNGTLWGMGYNGTGGLGLNDVVTRSSPVQIGALTDWSKVATSHTAVVAVKTDGTLWSWGTNTNGQLGQNNTTVYSSPKQIGSLTTWSGISGAVEYSATYGGFVAVKTNGTLWTWGKNHYGRFGTGNSTNYSSPKQIGALTTWAAATISHYSGLATKTAGTLWTWGCNYQGVMGNPVGVGGINSTPAQVGVLTDWSNTPSQLAAARKSAFAIKTDGTLWDWGYNKYGGILGQNFFAASPPYGHRSSPTQVGALTTWISISAGRQVLAIASH